MKGVSNSTNGGETKNKSYGSGLTSLRRKTEGAAASATGTSGRVIEMRNGRTSGEVYTSHYQSIGYPYTGIISIAAPGSSWYASWYARKSNSAPSNTGTVRQTVFIFGTQYVSNVYIYSFSGYAGVSANGKTQADPATGGTYYYAQNDMTTSWTKYEMAFTLDASKMTANGVLTMRLDNDDGRYGQGGENSTTKVYTDRLTLHPFNIPLRDSAGDGGSDPDNLNNFAFGTYAT